MMYVLVATVSTVLLLGGVLVSPSHANPGGDSASPVATSARLEPPADMVMHASLNKQVFQEGEEARISVRTNQPIYLHLLSVAQDGSVTVLMPTRVVPHNRILGGQEFVFPSDSLRELGLRMQVALPKGATRTVERIMVIATREKIDLQNKEAALNDVFHAATSAESGLLRDAMKKLIGLEPPDWIETTLPYEIRK